MQRTLLTSALVACLSLAMGSSAQSGITTGDIVKINTSTSTNAYPGQVPTLFGDANHSTSTLYGPGSGGEFLMSVTGGTAANIGSKFLTFCIETNEFITNNGLYQVVISDSANRGGAGGGSPDPLNVKTQSLFQQYYLGTLDDATSFDYNDPTDADELQEAIWYLENEIGSTSGLATTLKNLASVYNPLLGTVSVAQLYKVGDVVNGQLVSYPHFYQDQLIFTPPANVSEVPEATSVATWCALGLIGGGGFCWRRRRK